MRIVGVHPGAQCVGRSCVIHNPSEHHMREWPLNYRRDRWLTERMCPHGVGHPDPDDLAWHVSEGRDYQGVHGCDGCCRRYNSIEEKCPDCGGRGSYCGRCMGTGWLEVYRYEETTPSAMEISDTAQPGQSGRRHLPTRIPQRAHQDPLPFPLGT